MARATPTTAYVAKPNSEDSEVIKELHELGRAFQNAVGAYVIDNPSQFPAGTLTKKLTDDEHARLDELLNDRSHVNQDTMSVNEMEDHSIYYGVHLHCLFMECEERYLEGLKVSFKAVADSVDLDISDKAAVQKKLDVCERYGFDAMTRLLNLKLAA